MQWSEDYFLSRRRDVFTAEERQFIREYALVQLALHGITTYMPIAAETHSAWAESYDEMVGMAGPPGGSGCAAILARPTGPGSTSSGRTGNGTLPLTRTWGERGWRTPCVSLITPRTSRTRWSPESCFRAGLKRSPKRSCAATAAAARERDTLVRLHCLQGVLERDLLARRHSVTPLQLLERTGLLGADLLIPHGLVIDRNPLVHGADHGDLGTLAGAGVSIIHCPQTSFRYGSALHSFGTYRDAGINLCLGTDSFPPDLIRGMDTGVHLAKIVDEARDAAPAERYFEAATLGGARALQRPDLGKLEAGAQADLVAFSFDDFRDGVLEDPMRTLLLNGSARQVTHSVVAGRLVMRDGVIPGIDIQGLKAEAQRLFEQMREAYSERDSENRTPQQLFPPAFPYAREVSKR